MRIALVQSTDRLVNQLQQNVKQALEPLFAAPSGSFVAQLTGFATKPQATVQWAQGVAGCAITLALPTMSGTSNTTTMSLTGLPAALWPTAAQTVLLRVKDNSGAYAVGEAVFGTDGTVVISASVNGAAFTAAGTKAIGACAVTYILGR